MDYQSLDSLTSKWKEIETRLANVAVGSDVNRLSCQRWAGRFRIMYHERPIGDCTAQEKIEAVALLADFIYQRRNTLAALQANAAEADAMLGTILAKLDDDATAR